MAHAAADLLESWVRRIVRQSKDAGERRATSRSYDEVLERFARQALEGGVPVTAVVLSFSDAVFRPGTTQTRIGRIREQVRAADLVGRLGDGEIGMLLQDTPGSGARAVAARLRQVLQTADNVVSSVPVSVGFASRDPGEPKERLRRHRLRVPCSSGSRSRRRGRRSCRWRRSPPRRRPPLSWCRASGP